MSGFDDDDQPTPPVHYVVEAVLNSRRKRGKLEYYIKWKDYDASESSWEPAENCQCPDLINKFYAAKAAGIVKGYKKQQSICSTSSLSSVSIAKEQEQETRLINYVDSSDEDEQGTSSGSDTPRDVSVTSGDGQPSTSTDMDVEEKLTKIDEEEMPEEEDRVPSLSSVGDENASDSIASRDTSYLISAGEQVAEVLAITRSKPELMALVQYNSSEIEEVPTRLIIDCCPKPLAAFYESNINFRNEELLSSEPL